MEEVLGEGEGIQGIKENEAHIVMALIVQLFIAQPLYKVLK